MYLYLSMVHRLRVWCSILALNTFVIIERLKFEQSTGSGRTWQWPN